MPTLRVPTPGSWWSLSDIRLRGAYVDYELGPPEPTQHDGKWRTDGRGRIALEAFTALDLVLVAKGIEERGARARRTGMPPPETFDIPGARELEDFLLTFGPLMGGQGATFPVRNPKAERSEREAGEARLALSIWRDSGKDPGTIRHRQRVRRWMVSFEGWAQGYDGSAPDVTEEPRDHGRSEWLVRYRTTRGFLDEVIALADALALAAHWSSERAAKDRVRDLFLSTGGRTTVRLNGSTDWRRVIRGIPDAVDYVVFTGDGASGVAEDGRSPTGRSWAVDWLLAGRMLLADNLGRHVQWAPLYLAVDESGRLRTRWLTRSLEQVLYIQLLEHVQRVPRLRGVALPFWRLPRCGYCGGVIVQNPRKPTGLKPNRWHPGCRKAGQMRETRLIGTARTRGC